VTRPPGIEVDAVLAIALQEEGMSRERWDEITAWGEARQTELLREAATRLGVTPAGLARMTGIIWLEIRPSGHRPSRRRGR